MTPLDEGDAVPGYLEFLNQTYIAFQEFGLDSTRHPHDLRFTLKIFTAVRLLDVMVVFSIAFAFTALRSIFTVRFLRPFARYVALLPSDSDKFPESAWKLIVYSCLWSYSLYCVVLGGNNNFFHRPCQLWKDIVFDDEYWERALTMDLPRDIHWMYMVQLGFYVHSVIATLWMDTWRKDSKMMLFHHGITIFLIGFSFLLKYHKVGALVLYLHDISDILLEFTKINVYLKSRGGQYHFLNDALSTVGFLCFTASWAVFRLYWYPLKVLHATNWCVYLYNRGNDPKLFVVFNAMLWMLQGLNIYWFWFIVVLLVKIATGQMREINDTREFELAQRAAKLKAQQVIDHDHLTNGDGPKGENDERIKSE